MKLTELCKDRWAIIPLRAGPGRRRKLIYQPSLPPSTAPTPPEKSLVQPAGINGIILVTFWDWDWISTTITTIRILQASPRPRVWAWTSRFILENAVRDRATYGTIPSKAPVN